MKNKTEVIISQIQTMEIL